MNGQKQDQYEIDFYTGHPTAIVGDSVGWRIRSSCSALNRARTRGILEISKHTPPSKQISPDVWSASFDKCARQWELPIVPLNTLGLSHDEDGILCSEVLKPLQSGAEACPYLDEERDVVYKLFFLKASGFLGKKLTFSRNEEGEPDLLVADATLVDTLKNSQF